MSRPEASVRVLALPQIAPRAVRIEVACPHATTGITQVPASGGVALTIPRLTTCVVYRHEEECGRCDTTAAHARGDQTVRSLTESTWREQARQYTHVLRN